MPRPALRHLRRCRLLFVLALCAWLGLADTVLAQPMNCCGGMTSSMHHDGAPAPLHVDGGHADCACMHAPALDVPVVLSHGQPQARVPAWLAAVPKVRELPQAPPLRPPLA